MDFSQIICLAIIQGITEFLPISSSAHLILIPRIFGWEDQGLVFDVAVHVGSLAAVLLYFRHDLLPLILAWMRSLREHKMSNDARLVWAIIIATIPIGIVGFLSRDIIATTFRSPIIIAVATIVFGLLLWFADVKGRHLIKVQDINLRCAMVIGLMQIMALIPGASRSGTTMMAGLAMGLTRQAAARFSFLLSIPVIVLAGGLEAIELAQQTDAIQWSSICVAIVCSAISAYLCIHYFIKLLDRIGMLPFVVYRMILGIGLLVMFVSV